MKNNRNKWVHIRVSQQEHLAWHTLAHDHNLSLADYIRQLLGDNKPSRRSTKLRSRTCQQADPALLRAVARIGNNCNQIARWSNTHKSAAEALQVCTHLIFIQRQLADLLKQSIPSNETSGLTGKPSESEANDALIGLSNAD